MEHLLPLFVTWDVNPALLHIGSFGLLLGLWLFSRKNKMPYIWSLDRISIAVAISGVAVRLGNLMNSEIYGTVTSLPW